MSGKIEEPSLIYTKMPVKSGSVTDNINIDVVYYPSYIKLNPYQKYVYLSWLCDVKTPINIGYVFLFYYGLERHLLLGNYQDATDMILFLRQYHKNKSFYNYSTNALIMSAIFHKDQDNFDKIINSLDESYFSNISLTAKCRMNIDLTPGEIISLSSKAGYKNKHYMKKYPDLFKKYLTKTLENEYGKPAFPFYSLNIKYTRSKPVIFANYSFPPDARSPNLPNILDNTDFKLSIYKILQMTNELLKNELQHK